MRMIDGCWEAPGAYPGTSGPSGSKLFLFEKCEGKRYNKEERERKRDMEWG